jgi:RNA polymerase sigma factor (sigma-70 family)
MASAELGTVLRYIGRLAQTRADQDVSDQELLQRFCASHEDSAFAALMRRHGRLVWGVCRHVAEQEQDAEDAFQATFLVLARKAASIRKSEALSSWLYRTAQRIAVCAKKDARRRRIHEGRGGKMAPPKGLSEEALREAIAILDEEVQCLSAKHRAVFVSCCLEGKSRAEAARELGWKEGTVSGTLARARLQLQKRLGRRGVTLTAVMCAAALTRQSSAAVPSLLARSTIRAVLLEASGKAGASGIISAKVAALATGATKTMFAMKFKAATAYLLVFGALGGGVGVMVRQPEAAAQQSRSGRPVPIAQNQSTAPGAEVSSNRLEIAGLVLDPEGKPAAQADLYVGVPAEFGPRFEKMAASDANGRFAFTTVKSGAAKPVVIAVAKGYGPDWIGLNEAKGELSLRLVKDLPIEGRILDTDGKPVAGAKIRIAGVSGFTGENADTFLADIQTGLNVGDAGNGVGPKHWDGPLPGQDEQATTDKEGRFRLTGIGRERHVRLHLAGPAIQHDYFQAVTRDTKPVSVPGPFRVKIYGANLDFVAAAGRSVRGVVRAKSTGKPIADVVVSGGGTTFSVHTDKEGRFEVQGCPKSEKYQVAAAPGAGQPYPGGRKEIDDTPGLEPLTADIELVSGIPLKGRLTDKDTGKAVSGARVAYYPVVPNPFTLDVAYDPRQGASSATTAADGSYQLTVLPGAGLLTVRCPPGNPYMAACIPAKEIREFFKGRDVRRSDDQFIEVQQGGNSASPVFQEYHQAIALIDPGENDTALEKDVTVQRGKTLTGTVVGPDGAPLEGVTLDGKVLAGGKFTLNNLNPRRPRGLYFLQKDKGLGLYTEALTNEDKPVTARLQPCGSAVGRLVDQDGQPLAGEVVRIPSIADMKTDKEGRFRVDHLVVGFRYEVRNAALFASYFGEFTVEPGEVKDLGDKKVNK